MSPPGAVPPPRPSLVHRYGPLSVVLVALVIAGVFASTGDRSRRASAPAADTTPASAERDIAISWLEASRAGTIGEHDWGDGCDTVTGKMKLPSVYSPPCVAARPDVEGGATYPGVTEDRIKVVLYEAADDDLTALLDDKTDPADVAFQQRSMQIEMFAKSLETWGRRIEVVRMKGRGADEASARADAIKVASEIGAFASIGGPGQENAYAEELARRGVLCISCGLSLADRFYQEHDPYVWGSMPSPEQYLPMLSEVAVDMLNGKKAEFAGDPDFRDRDRVFGTVHFEQDPPVFTEVNERVDAVAAARGFERKIKLTYQLVIAELPEKARTIVSRLKGAGVTTVIFLGDPIMPIYLTQAATDQNYFPEWVITGTVLTDTSTMGRLYDQKQWANAFGISPLPVPVDQELGEGWRLHEWFYGEPPVGEKSVSLSFDSIRMFLFGVHLAGPNLTPETFRDGLFGYPPSGGTATEPRLSWGSHGLFEEPDHLGVDDMRLVWWDADAEGPDEQGEEGSGLLRTAFGGKRFLLGEMPKTVDWIGDDTDAPANFSDPGLVDPGTPDYPSPRIED